MRLLRLMLGGWNVLDDEDFFTRTDESELAAGNFLDRRRIFFQPPSLLAQPHVFSALTRHRRRGGIILASRANHRQQTSIADQAVDDDDDGHKEQQQLNDFALPAGPWCRPGLASGCGLERVFRHARTTLQQRSSKYKHLNG